MGCGVNGEVVVESMVKSLIDRRFIRGGTKKVLCEKIRNLLVAVGSALNGSG